MLPVYMYQADSVDEETIRSYGEKWVDMIDDPTRSVGRTFLENKA